MKLRDFELELSEADIEKIRLAFENPPEPNEALIVAARKYKLAFFEKMAEEAWEGCDGCDENDKQFFISGFITALFSIGYELK